MELQVTVLEEEHRKFNTLIREMARYESPSAMFFAELTKIIEAHSELEEQIIEPLLAYILNRNRSGAVFDRLSLEKSYGLLVENYDGMLETHSRMKKMLEDARGVTYKIEVQGIVDQICHHIRMEEQIAYPAALAAGEILHFDNRRISHTKVQ